MLPNLTIHHAGHKGKLCLEGLHDPADAFTAIRRRGIKSVTFRREHLIQLTASYDQCRKGLSGRVRHQPDITVAVRVAFATSIPMHCKSGCLMVPLLTIRIWVQTTVRANDEWLSPCALACLRTHTPRKLHLLHGPRQTCIVSLDISRHIKTLVTDIIYPAGINEQCCGAQQRSKNKQCCGAQQRLKSKQRCGAQSNQNLTRR